MDDFLSADQPDFTAGVAYEVLLTDGDVQRALAELSTETLLGVDTENSGLDPHDGWPILLQIGTPEKCYIFPAYLGLDRKPLKSFLEDSKRTIILFNAKYDWRWLDVHYNIQMRNIFCLQVAERLLTVGQPGAHRRPSLKWVVRKYLGIDLKKEVRNSFIGRDPVADPLTEREYCYAAGDTVLLSEVFFQQVKLLRELDLLRVAQLEFDVLPVFAEAENAGVLIDVDGWRREIANIEAKKAPVAQQIYKCFAPVIAQKTLFGVPTFNIGSTKQLQTYLKKLGFDLPDTEEATIKRYEKKHEVFKLLLVHRGLDKLISTYGEKLLARISTKTGRLHCEFHQVQADTGRVSSAGPNLQNIPKFNAKDQNTCDLRTKFIAKSGYRLVTADYSQQELRCLAELSQDPLFRRAYTELDENGKDLDLHALTAEAIFGKPYAEAAGSPERDKAKTINFAIPYGTMAFTLAESLGVDEAQAQQYIDEYFNRFPKVRGFLDSAGNTAVSRGYTVTVSGRRRWLPMPPPDDADFRKMKQRVQRQGKNTLIQGSSADVTKMAMVLVSQRLRKENLDARIILVVHDELVVEAREDQAEAVARIVEEEMINGWTYYFKEIPMRVDAHVAPVWKK